jgi:predicted DNA binding protein
MLQGARLHQRYLDGGIVELSKVSKIEVEGKSVSLRESATEAIAVPVDEFSSSLTRKQLATFLAAMQMGHYGMPKRATLNEITSRQGMKWSTCEEHLRKAESKVLQAVRPCARPAYITSEGKEQTIYW